MSLIYENLRKANSQKRNKANEHDSKHDDSVDNKFIGKGRVTDTIKGDIWDRDDNDDSQGKTTNEDDILDDDNSVLDRSEQTVDNIDDVGDDYVYEKEQIQPKTNSKGRRKKKNNGAQNNIISSGVDVSHFVQPTGSISLQFDKQNERLKFQLDMTRDELRVVRKTNEDLKVQIINQQNSDIAYNKNFLLVLNDKITSMMSAMDTFNTRLNNLERSIFSSVNANASKRVKEVEALNEKHDSDESDDDKIEDVKRLDNKSKDVNEHNDSEDINDNDD